MAELQKLARDAVILPLIAELPLFLAVLARAQAFVSGDTGPLHFAAGLGVPTISLFGPSPPVRWAPIGEQHQVLTGSLCSCGNVSICQSANHCLAAITPEQVFTCLQNLLKPG
jgi:ADP-heptose:LPS heptosyltransferase